MILELGKAFNAQAREILDGEIARMFYLAGLPFNLAKNPHFIKSYSLAANSNVAGYNPPSYNALRTKLLKNERSHLQTLLEATKSTWKSKGVTIDVITEVGVPNVVQVITDNAPVCKAAGMLVEQAYPSVFWTPCVVHTLNLALKNICAAKNTESNEITYAECRWISEIAASAIMIRNFIMNLSMRLAMFTEFSKLKLLVVAETRFASMIIMLKRFRDVKCQLQSMVISEQWSMYREDNIEKARIVKEKLLDDGWWDSVGYILRFTKPIYSMLRICDTDKPCMHLVYGMWDTMIVKVKRVIFEHEMKSDLEESSFWNVVCNVLEDRWSKSNTQLHCLAHSLTPSNLRLLSRRTPQYMKGESQMWDVAGDAFDAMDDIGILGIANLSLDEPELESILFCDDGEGKGPSNSFYFVFVVSLDVAVDEEDEDVKDEL
ncbi:uncharacterized protein LOC131008025 [Salvia miltiorrhiza]|uniref:uncharacterized protein LOC131008025 n=1 Tax=Salvia miltiorrhiza TaxID=226208 RepID=UPI0025AC5240|nr:uncharacterized protein LOC131008025 [Salvia miltiorrhiza]